MVSDTGGEFLLLQTSDSNVRPPRSFIPLPQSESSAHHQTCNLIEEDRARGARRKNAEHCPGRRAAKSAALI